MLLLQFLVGGLVAGKGDVSATLYWYVESLGSQKFGFSELMLTACLCSLEGEQLDDTRTVYCENYSKYH